MKFRPLKAERPPRLGSEAPFRISGRAWLPIFGSSLSGWLRGACSGNSGEAPRCLGGAGTCYAGVSCSSFEHSCFRKRGVSSRAQSANSLAQDLSKRKARVPLYASEIFLHRFQNALPWKSFPELRRTAGFLSCAKNSPSRTQLSHVRQHRAPKGGSPQRRAANPEVELRNRKTGALLPAAPGAHGPRPYRLEALKKFCGASAFRASKTAQPDPRRMLDRLTKA